MIRAYRTMKVTNRYRTDTTFSWDGFNVNAFIENRIGDRNGIAHISGIDESGYKLVLEDSAFGSIIFDAWKHYGIVIDEKYAFIGLGTKDPDFKERRKELVAYIQSGILPGGVDQTPESSTDPDDIVF